MLHVIRLNRECSDHALIVVHCAQQRQEGHGVFKFQNMWVKHKQFIGTVKTSWSIISSGNPLDKFVAKLKQLRRNLSMWYKESFGNLFKNIDQAKNAKSKLSHILKYEETFWKQRAKVKWCRRGI